MSFSSELKEELSKLNTLANKELVKYELIGYLLTNHATIQKNRILRYATESEYNINRYSKLLLNLDINHQIDIEGNMFVIKLKVKDIPFLLEFDDKNKTSVLYRDIKLENGAEEPKKKKEENAKSIIRGAFLGAGSINNPENSYHLEIVFSSKENTKYIKGLLESVFGLYVKELDIENKTSIYLKEAESISNFLALVGANKAMLKFEDIRIQKEMRGKVNRIVNCETANLNKTLNAAVEQINAIKKLQETGEFNKLDDDLKEVALLRLEYPNMSLAELGKRLKNPIGKSGVNYRLKKILGVFGDGPKKHPK